MKILITGANGYIGKCLIRDLSEYDVIAKSRQELDIYNKEQVDSFFTNNEVDYVIRIFIDLNLGNLVYCYKLIF